MDRKQSGGRRIKGVLALGLLSFAGAHTLSAQATDSAPAPEAHPVIGSRTCANSSCHGGADDKSSQFVIWSQHDVHSRSYATLTTARARRMAEALKIPDATKSARCTTCHAPLQAVAPSARSADADVMEGVSCVSCHGPAQPWLRTHTRPDLTHDERIGAGMRELRDLYHRANACVACHQNVESALIGTGRHPALHFELDGMTRSQPKHWREAEGYSGAQAWFVGQAVALRETSWALAHGGVDPVRETPRWRALLWLLPRARPDVAGAALGELPPNAVAENLGQVVRMADEIARRAAREWSAADTKHALTRLANTHGEFADTKIPALAHACRAERLVMALDRLLAARAVGDIPPGASAGLDRLFRLVQSQPDFAPAAFARELAAFARFFGS